MDEVQVYFQSDEKVDRGFRKVFLNPFHKGYSAFQPAGGIAIAYNDMKVLEAHELFSAITKGTKYCCKLNLVIKSTELSPQFSNSLKNALGST